MDDEAAPARIHCKQDGWVSPGACPHCYAGCSCGKRCTGPFLTGLDEHDRPSYSPFMADAAEAGAGEWRR